MMRALRDVAWADPVRGLWHTIGDGEGEGEDTGLYSENEMQIYKVNV